MTDDLETHLTTLLRERADSVDLDLDVCRARLTAAPAARAGRRFVVGTLGLGLAAGLAAALAIGNGWLPADRTPAGGPTTASSMSSVPTTGAHNVAALAGTWRITKMDGHPIAADADEGTITLAESGWWRADAGCVAVGGWFTWDPATGSFSAGDYTQPDRMPPAKDETCYRPSILSAIWPGMRLVRQGADLRVVDGQGKEYLRLTRTSNAALYAPPRLEQLEGQYQVTGAWLDGGLRALSASGVRVLLTVANDRLEARFGAADCLWDMWGSEVSTAGRLTGDRTTGAAEGSCPHPLTGNDARVNELVAQAQAVSSVTPGQLIVGSDEIAVAQRSVVLLGNAGQVLMTLTRMADPPPAGERMATPNDLIGDWRLTYLASEPDRSFGDFSVLRIRAGEGGDTLDWLVAPGCPIRQGTLHITTTGDQQEVAPGRSEKATPATAVCDPKAEVFLAADLMSGATSYAMTVDGGLALRGSGVPVLAVFERAN